MSKRYLLPKGTKLLPKGIELRGEVRDAQGNLVRVTRRET